MKKVDQILLKFEKHAAKILLMVMIVLVFASGVARFLKHPINWAVDISSFLFAWACFFAVDVAWRENKMMSVDILVKKFSERTQKIIRIVNYLIILAFIVYLIVWGFYLSYKTRYRTFVGIPNFSYTWVTLSVPVGAILLFRTTVLKLIEEFRGNKKEER
ncbi:MULTISPECIES: TRAP transporter small permease [unclassified Thermotoga]|uniref:TRAP transporter small permease n=1 Tax=unclassified Thermotoga TaxID=2631113 RepID=UPI000280E826|nr:MULTISPECIES: TRAP transporter small permease [unclassified Thermotoga]AIY86169.1 tripartite ATP-independent periplasmic transporter DctQ [Thermotoga sp. 2812B]EJX26105.1 tripartite ATP-independent periplasmic transporter DctQ [Thermotoga sp. EMP]